MADDLAGLVRRCWSLLELLHVAVYFAPQPAEEYAAIGLTEPSPYFASRSAPMGAVPAEVVTATFYNFSPDLIATAMAGVWEKTTPAEVLAARHRGISATLRAILPESAAAAAAEAAALVRAVTEDLPVAGRPLFAGHAALPWPDDPLLALWHGGSLVREFRGDGHVAVLVANEVAPLDACITGGIAANLLRFNRKTRGWTEAQWSAATDRLVADGLVASASADPLQLTERGWALRDRLEDQTEQAAAYGWQAIGADGLRRLDELATPLVDAVVEAGVLPRSVRSSKQH